MTIDFGKRGPAGLALALAGLRTAALAQEAAPAPDAWDLYARVTVGERYDDNIFSTENDKRGDFVTVIAPEVTLEGGTETFRLGALRDAGGSEALPGAPAVLPERPAERRNPQSAHL